MPADLPKLAFASRAKFRKWLGKNGESSDGVWVKFAKKGTGHASVTTAEAVEEALAHGWIDGQAAKFDAEWWLVRFTPRRQRSKWSKVNTETVARLTEQGLMTPAGLAQVEAARADGRWEAAYSPASTAKVPDDLRQALAARPGALEFFEGLSGANRYAILYRIETVKRAETRRRNIEKFADMCAEGKTLH